MAKYGFIKEGIVEFHSFNATNGMPEQAPFDKIISAASGQELPCCVERAVENRRQNSGADKDAIHLFVKKACPPKMQAKINLKRAFIRIRFRAAHKLNE